MKVKRHDSTKRNFFAKAGMGVGAGLLWNFIPFSKTLGRKSVAVSENNKLKVQINPLAVKRNNKDSK